jgi:cysteine desulfurase NifS
VKSWQRAICGICPAGCWVEVKVEGGKLSAIRPEKGSPLGMICRRGEHAAEIVHSEHRLKTPLKRTGAKGDFDFTPISWDEAYDLITENMIRIKEESGPEALGIYTGRGSFELSLCDMFQPKGVAVSSASNLLFPFGSPNTMGVGALCYVAFAMIAPHVTMGRMLVDMFNDMENAELLVVWGANPATDSPPLDMHRLEAATRRGAEIVVIDPRRTETALRTNARWIPIRPGTDCALALSMIAVLVDEDIFDEDFAQNWCHGFDELKTYIQHFSPEVAETITGVPAETIRDLARRIATADGACPVMYTGLEYSNSGVQAIRAVLSLFSLAGHLDVAGGIGLSMQGSHFPINRSCNQENPDVEKALARDRFPLYTRYRDESHPLGFLTSVLEGTPYKMRGLLVQGASILTSWPQTPRWKEALSKLDFMVSIDRQMTADMAYADVVLPAATGFEISSYMVYGPVFRLREKIIEPVGEARNDYLIMAELADRLGYGHLYPQSEDELVRFALEGSGYSLEDIRKADGQMKLPAPMMEYKKWQKGGLRPDGQPGFDTPSGKFEIFSTALDDFGHEPLPKYVEPKEGPIASPDLTEDYPLVFNSGARPQTDFRSQHHGVESLCRDNPEPVVEINEEDAASRGIKDGDLVEVKSPRGGVHFRAVVSGDIVKGAVECNMGGGGPVGPKAWRKSNVNELTDVTNHDEISGFPVYKALLCEVVKIETGDGKTSSKRKKAKGGIAVLKARKKPRRLVYLDNSATTRTSVVVNEAMAPFCEDAHGNPSSIHHLGRTARDAVSDARRKVAALVGARPRRIVFCGGGSEADNMALKGVVFADPKRSGHIITSAIEHPAILSACAFIEKLGWRVTYLPVDADGLVSPEKLRAAMKKDTALVSIMMANNEVGALQPIKQLCAIAHDAGALFHTDAVQAAGRIGVDVMELGVDMLSLSAHKFHGPKGVGALYVADGIALEPLVHGGSQEGRLRAGTENVAAIVGMGAAADVARRGLDRAGKTRALRDQLEAGIRELFPTAVLNAHVEKRLPNVLNLTLPNLRGESVVVAMDQRGIALSSGSACKSGSPDPTHVLLAMGRSADEAHCSVRFSLAFDTSEADIAASVSAFSEVLEEMETTVRFLPCK